MMFLVLFLLGFTSISVYGYRLLSTTSQTWQEANTACKATYGTTLATITNDIENADVEGICDGNCWIGGNDLVIANTWVWESNRATSITMCYDNWETNEPNNAGTEACLEIYDTGKWNDKSCADRSSTRKAVCNEPKYKKITTTSTWEISDASCFSMFETTLATITSLENNVEVSNLCGNNNCWIGLNDKTVENTWEWKMLVGRRPITCYKNWNDGEPNNSGEEDCVEIYANGKWNDGQCTTARKAICNAPHESNSEEFIFGNFNLDIATLISASAVLFLFSMLVVTFVCYRKRRLAKMNKYNDVEQFDSSDETTITLTE